MSHATQVHERPKPFVFPEYCKGCGRCIESCPKNCITMGTEINPSTEGAELMAKLLPKLDGVFLQAVSEVATVNHMYGCGGAGLRSMTFTSSPGFSLMLEGISYMIGAEVLGVFVNVMRGGPGLGNIAPEQADIKLACRGLGHGNTHAIVLAPSTPQEMLDPTMLSFDLAFKYRNPEVIGGVSETVPRFCGGFPEQLGSRDIALKLAGAGGDGAQTAAMLITRAAINEGFDSTHIPSYGPESRGGTSYADVHIAEDEVLSPASPKPDVLVAFNAPSLAKFGSTVVRGGTVIYDSSVIHELPPLAPGVHVHGVPLTSIAADLGRVMVRNVVALGALQAATGLFPKETFLTAIRQALKEKCAMIPLNEQAFDWGVRAIATA